MRKSRKENRPVALIVGGRDLFTLLGEPVRVQCRMLGVPRFVDGVLRRILSPSPSGKGAGIELRSLTKEKHRKPVFTTVAFAPQTKENPSFMWRYDPVIKYRTVVKYRTQFLPASGIQTVQPLLMDEIERI